MYLSKSPALWKDNRNDTICQECSPQNVSCDLKRFPETSWGQRAIDSWRGLFIQVNFTESSSNFMNDYQQFIKKKKKKSQIWKLWSIINADVSGLIAYLYILS